MKKERSNKKHYYQFSGFEHIYLEDSYVLDVKVEPQLVEIIIDAVLKEDHPQYVSPRSDEQYCYKKACISFPLVKEVTWIKRIMRPYRDASDEIDYGNIDEFCFTEGHYRLRGDWGELDIVSNDPIFSIVK